MLIDAKLYLKKHDISFDDFAFLQLKEMLKDNLKYTYIFTIFHYQQSIKIDVLENLYNELVVLKDHLSKMQDVTTYRDYATLIKDLERLREQIFLKNFTKLLPKKLEDSFQIFNFERDLSKIRDFFELHQEYQKDFIRNVSRHKDQKSLLKDLKAYINIVKSKKDILTIKKTYQDVFGLKKIYEDENVFLCETVEPETIRKIGTSSWCIARDASHWRTYVTNKTNARQYVLWNANLEHFNPNHQIAFTLNSEINPYGDNKHSYTAHNRRNDALNLEQYLKENKLDYLLKELCIKNTAERVIDILDYYQNHPNKNPGWFAQRFNFDKFYDSQVIMNLMDPLLIEKYQAYDDTALLKLINCSNRVASSVIFYYLFRLKLCKNLKFIKILSDNIQNISSSIKISDSDSIDMLTQVIKSVLDQKYTKVYVVKFQNIFSAIVPYKGVLNKCIKELSIFVELNENFFNHNMIVSIKRNIDTKIYNDPEAEKIRKDLLQKIDYNIYKDEKTKKIKKSKHLKEILKDTNIPIKEKESKLFKELSDKLKDILDWK